MIDIRKKEEFIWIIVSNESLFRDNTQFWYAWVLLNKRKKKKNKRNYSFRIIISSLFRFDMKYDLIFIRLSIIRCRSTQRYFLEIEKKIIQIVL